MFLQLATSDDLAAGEYDGVAGLGLGSSWIVTDSRAIPVSTKIGISVHLETIATFRV